jgi:membrane protein
MGREWSTRNSALPRLASRIAWPGKMESRLKQLQAEVASTLNDDSAAPDDVAARDGVRRFVHFWALVGTLFWRNRCQVRASALAYTTLLALVPLLAVSISVAAVIFSSGDSEARLREWIRQGIHSVAPTLGLADAGGDNSREPVVSSIMGFVSNIRFGTIGATAMAGLVFAAISLLRTIEAAFNDIWGVGRARNLWLSVVLYWAVLTLGPVLVLVATTSSYVRVLFDQVSWVQTIPVLGLLNTALVPVAMLTLGFSVFYRLMPNTRVDIRAAAVGGLVAAVLWWGNNQLGALYNTKVVMYSKIYGSLGAIPLFLVGLYLSWMILLFGSQVAYVYQNRHAYLQEKHAERVNQAGRELAALRLVTEIGRRFMMNQPGLSAEALAAKLGVPPRLTRKLLGQLTQSRLLCETTAPDLAYAPARPLEQITVHDVFLALRTGSGDGLLTSDQPSRSVVRQEIDAIRLAEAERAKRTSLADLARRAQSAEASVTASGTGPGPV